MTVRQHIVRLGSAKRFGAPIVVAGMLCVPAAVGAAWVADAQEITGAIKGVDLTSTESDVAADMKLALTWAVPDGSHAGDTFTLTLPDQLKAVDGMKFDLTNGKDVVARAVVTGQVVTFTLTDFAESHQQVSGSAWFGVTFAKNVTPGQTLDLKFTSEGVVFTDSVKVTGTGPGDYSTAATKWQTWADGTKNSPPRPAADRILWAINGPRITKDFAGTTYTFTDTPGEGEAVDCDSIALFWGDSNAGGVSPKGWFGPDRYTKTCSPSQLVVTLKTRADDTGHIPGVLGWSAVTQEGLSAYRNSGSVRIQDVGTWNVGHVLKVSGGGDGDGVTPTPTPTTTSPTTSPTTPVPTDSGTPTTSPTTPVPTDSGTPAPTTTSPTTAPPTTAPPTTPVPTDSGTPAPTTAPPTTAPPTTPAPSNTGTPAPSNTGTPTATGSPAPSNTGTPTSTGSPAPSNTGSASPTNTSSASPTNTGSASPTSTGSASPTASGTSTSSASPTASGTSTSVAPARPASPRPTVAPARTVAPAAPSTAAGSPSRIDTGVPAQEGTDSRLVAGGLALLGLGGAGLTVLGRRRPRHRAGRE